VSIARALVSSTFPLDNCTSLGKLIHVMRTFKIVALLGIILLLVCVAAFASPVPSDLLSALNQVEASGRTSNVPAGDKGKAIGPFQIHRAYWQDSGVAGSYLQCTNYTYSVQVVNGYLNRYGRKFLMRNDYESLSRIHNGGPRGYAKESTKAYWLKVQKHLRDQHRASLSRGLTGTH